MRDTDTTGELHRAQAVQGVEDRAGVVGDSARILTGPAGTNLHAHGRGCLVGVVSDGVRGERGHTVRRGWPGHQVRGRLLQCQRVGGVGSPRHQLQADQLARSAAPAGAAWVDQIRALVDGAASLQDIRDGLEQLLPDMTLEQYAQAMAEALAAAQLAGRYEVLQEAGGIGG